MSDGHHGHLPAEERRRAILDVAAGLFATKGFDATTIQDVIAAAGLSKGGFYHHFPSKEALLEALVDRIATQSLEQLGPLRRATELDPFARLDAILRQLLSRKAALDPGLRRAFETLFAPQNLVLYDRLRRASVRAVLPVLVEVIAEGMADRTFAVSDARSCALLILHLNAAAYDAIGAALAERDSGRPGAARRELHALTAMQGVAIDRLLGLPDGSITWLESGWIDAMLGWEPLHASG